ncbi:MAG: nuclear transport factor 2 family protein [Chloroflexi bacterium]|nr:nuclear transport factor 2 family protein [Chloroflexota bacterium]
MADDDLQAAITRMQAATVGFLNGDVATWNSLCSHEPDATLFGGWGGYERGWDELEPRYEWASARFAGGQIEFEEIGRFTSGDLAYTAHFERSRPSLTGRTGAAPMVLRVTHIYRREDGAWKLVHRHADPIATIQAPEAVLTSNR